MVIPNDKGGSWRFDKMVEFISIFPDEIYPAVNDFFNKRQANSDDKVWWVLLYSACYSVTSACIMFDKLKFDSLTPESVHEFWTENKQKLIFQSDRRYIKNMNQFEDIVNQFKYNVSVNGGTPYRYIKSMLSDSPQETYKTLYKNVLSWKFYGRFGVMLFMNHLNKFLGVSMEHTNYSWQQGATTTSAMFNAVYKDDLADDFDKKGFTLSKEQIDSLDNLLYLTIQQLNKINPKKDWTIMGVSYCLCAYRKLFKSSRYLTYYIDRQQEELNKVSELFPEYGETWNGFYESRKNFLPYEYLGELNGWNGCRKEKMKSWVERGELI